MYKYFIRYPPQKQVAIPAEIKMIATSNSDEFKYWINPEGYKMPQPALWKALNSSVHLSKFLAKKNLS